MIKIIAWVAVIAGRLCCFEPLTVPSTSMQPSLHPGDLLLLDKRGFGRIGMLGYDLIRMPVQADAVPAPGTHVVYESPVHSGTIVVTRLIGQPGGEIKLHARTLRIDDEQVSTPTGECDDEHCVIAERIGGLEYPVIYRRSGSIPSAEGTWHAGNGWFVMGDNRDNSFDSRYHGPIAASELRARVIARVDRTTVVRVVLAINALFTALP